MTDDMPGLVDEESNDVDNDAAEGENDDDNAYNIVPNSVEPKYSLKQQVSADGVHHTSLVPVIVMNVRDYEV